VRREFSAGGIVVRRMRGREWIAAIRPQGRPAGHWVLPKGHIEAGETPEQTAEREVLEEAGVDAEVVAPIGDVAFEFGNQSLRIRYFLMRSRGTKTALEDREICWCSPADAERLLEFENVKEIVRRAAETDARR